MRDALRRLDGVAQAHSTTPVPVDQTVPGYRIALICIGVSFTLTGLYAGSILAATLGLRIGILAVVIGSALLTLMSLPAAVLGARTRLSTYMIVTRVFGATGSKLVNAVLAVVLLGWYAVTAELFGRTFYLTVTSSFPSLLVLPQCFYTIACSGVVMATTIFGFRAIDRLSLYIAPLLVALTGYVAWRSLAHASWGTLMAMPGTHPNLRTGISAVIGGMIVNVVLMPDITRYARSTFDCAVISLTGNGIGAGGALVLAMIPALAFGEQDPMKYMAALGLVGAAFTTLVLSTWTLNAINLYSTSLVTSTALRGVSYGRVVIGCGVVGTAVAVIGVADRLIDFLVLLGLIVPPIAAVYLTDFFVLGRRAHFAGAGATASTQTNVNGVAACLAGTAVGLSMYFTSTSLTGVPTIESFLCAALSYLGAEAVRKSLIRDRSWRRAIAL
jgi:cytosine permease